MIDGLFCKHIKWDLIWLHNNGYHEWSGSWKQEVQSKYIKSVTFNNSIKINKTIILSSKYHSLGHNYV